MRKRVDLSLNRSEGCLTGALRIDMLSLRMLACSYIVPSLLCSYRAGFYFELSFLAGDGSGYVPCSVGTEVVGFDENCIGLVAYSIKFSCVEGPFLSPF